jgi:prepilin-type N-terminal cleavage/methylation domain-containing protein
MYAISHARAARLARGVRGFSLIELGIVIAVIAVLAAVVIFGRGFIVASRVSKLVEAANTVRKGASTYAGLMGGSLSPAVTPAVGISALSTRQLLPPLNNNLWVVSGPTPATTESFVITGVGLGQIPGPGGGPPQNAVSVQFRVPKPENAQDVIASVLNDPNFVRTQSQEPGGSGGVCAANPLDGQANLTTICFNL